ncbi:MAG TPA: response regulator [Spirochaetales bacterium]|nr:response regulator [Spirochaetales bacterium]HRY54578.1 response regulator [Spirochaetia bacterium]HRZ64586.1 response regulator [Spirochaetia bacterium]
MGPAGRSAILCVDDEAIILLSMKQELKRRFGGRFIVETALDASEAQAVIDELAAREVDTSLVISDWFMPGVRGDQFLVELHARKPWIKAILVTGHADEAAVERARREAGLAAALRKPWRPEELFSAVETALGL